MKHNTDIHNKNQCLLRAEGTVPPLLVLEVTYRCANKCRICFHRDKRDKHIDDMPLELALHSITEARQTGVRRMRLTGGEPLLYPHCLELLKNIRNAGLKVWLNSAAPANSPWKQVGSLVDDILLPLRDRDQRKWISHVIHELRSGGNLRIRTGTILSRKRIEELPEIMAFAHDQRVILEFYRIISLPGHITGNSRDELEEALMIIDRINRKKPPAQRARIANAIPFCIIKDRRKVARNAWGGRFDDGRTRLIVSPQGDIRPSYPFSKVFGNIKKQSLVQIWNHPSLVLMHSAEALPAQCRKCTDLNICQGGSRCEAYNSSGDVLGMDPLAMARQH